MNVYGEFEMNMTQLNTQKDGMMNKKNDKELRPLPPQKALLTFLLAGFGFRFAIYNGIPLLQELGLSAFEAFLVAFTVPLAVLFSLAFESTKREGVALEWRSLATRFRLKRLERHGFLWLFLALITALILSGLLTPTRDWVLQWAPFLQPPTSFPPILHPDLQNAQLGNTLAVWMGNEAKGNIGYAFLILLLFFFNMFGEELYWRGIILPRQELVHGRYTWLVHGLMWNLFHLPFYPWYLIYGLPITLGVSFVAQKTGNTWFALLMHAIANITITILMLGFIFS